MPSRTLQRLGRGKRPALVGCLPCLGGRRLVQQPAHILAMHVCEPQDDSESLRVCACRGATHSAYHPHEIRRQVLALLLGLLEPLQQPCLGAGVLGFELGAQRQRDAWG
eukprot:scaffold30513_cov123-Isochrysis_galbana.AAC.4